MSEETKLLQCAFCGDTWRYVEGNANSTYYVECKKCHARTANYSTAEQAIAAWNRRPKPRNNFEKWKEDLTVEEFDNLMHRAGCARCPLGCNAAYGQYHDGCAFNITFWANTEAGDE